MTSSAINENAIFNYDYESDIFFAKPVSRKNQDYDRSIDLGDLILDVDANQKIIGLEVMNASKRMKINPADFRNFINAKVEITGSSNKTLHITISITYEVRNGLKNDVLSITEELPEHMSCKTINFAMS